MNVLFAYFVQIVIILMCFKCNKLLAALIVDFLKASLANVYVGLQQLVA